jgi:hypothetical protein
MKRAIQFIGVIGFTAGLVGQSVEQTANGTAAPPRLVAQSDGLGVGFEGSARHRDLLIRWAS